MASGMGYTRNCHFSSNQFMCRGSNSWLKGTIQEVNMKELTCTLRVGAVVITKFSLVCDYILYTF